MKILQNGTFIENGFTVLVSDGIWVWDEKRRLWNKVKDIPNISREAIFEKIKKQTEEHPDYIDIENF